MRILTTFFKGQADSRRVVRSGIPTGFNNAFLRSWWPGGETAVWRSFLDDGGLPAIVVAEVFADVLVGSIGAPMLLGNGDVRTYGCWSCRACRWQWLKGGLCEEEGYERLSKHDGECSPIHVQSRKFEKSHVVIYESKQAA